MNKRIDTKSERVFMSLVGPSGCGKTHFIFDLIRNNVFTPPFDKILYFYKYDQDIFKDAVKEFGADLIEFIEGVNFDLIKSLPADGTNYLLIFDDSCGDICDTAELEDLATAGRHKRLHVIYVKHNLFQKTKRRTTEIGTNYIVLFKNPRDKNQIQILANQTKIPELVEWFNSATSKPYGNLMIDFSNKQDDHLRYSEGLNYTRFFLPKTKRRITFLKDVHTKLLYSEDSGAVAKKSRSDSNKELVQ